MTADEIRQSFLRFFGEKGHKVVPGSSLIPHGDPTLLLTSAGMVQFKPYFLGEAVPPSPRLASCQKCFRVTDIDSVGDTTHLTFFEMLGNFSIGDYFKKEAIGWAWEFVTGRLGLPPERLWITLYLDDDEAFNIWCGLGVPADRILKLGEEDNFWGPAGDSGPCGPCSEIHYDFGEGIGCGQPTCAPGCGCGRFFEIWNLVFMQYNQGKAGKRAPLAKCHIDTGMGLERTAAVMQGKRSVYETDLLAPLVERVSELAGKGYGDDRDSDNAIRVIAEHGRGIAFLIADGVLPANEGRGYVVRRLLRRAALFGRRLGLDKPFLAEVARATVEIMKHVYPELGQRRDFIVRVIETEEAGFDETLSTGLEFIEGLLDYREAHRDAIPELIAFLRDFKPASENTAMVLEQYGFVGGGLEKGRLIGVEIAAETISQLIHDFLERFEEEGEFPQDIFGEIQRWGQQVSGSEVFRLYDTYGFPVELTKEIARKQGFSVDMAGFEREMEKQRRRAKAGHLRCANCGKRLKGIDNVCPNCGSTERTYGSIVFDIEISDRIRLGANVNVDIKKRTEFVGYESLKHNSVILSLLVDSNSADSINEGQEASLILEATPFYAEMGGQVGDTGEIIGASGRFVVTDTVQLPQGIIVHRGCVAKGSLSVGDEVEAIVDKERRLDIARNHTATHLLQYALRQVLGEHVHQRGSLVAPDRLRFDFSHLTAMTGEELDEVQRIVNEKVRQNLPVSPCYVPYKQAIEAGAIALFGEKYGDVVRMLKIGEPAVSAELCGGTHVSATGEIGFFYVLSESSIGGGLRRIEAVTGRGAEKALKDNIDSLKNEALASQAELEQERKRVQALENKLARGEAEALLGQVEVINGIKVLSARVSSYRLETMRDMADVLRDKLGSGIVVLGAIAEDRPSFIVAVTPDLVKKGYHAGNIVKRMAEVAGGGGGGKAGLAQGGGRDKDKLDEALRLVRSLV